MALNPTQLRRLRLAAHNGNRVRSARQLAGLTQQQLAAALNTTQAAISDVERRRHTSITVESARRFADYFGCAIEDLFPARDRQEVA